MENKYILAVYDFRSKQEYIYKTNKVKEIMGASKLLETAYENAIEEYNKNGEKVDKEKSGKFTLDEFEKSNFSACILYEGGGNLLMLFKSECEFTAFNNHFSWYLIKNAPGISPICGKAKFDSTKNYDENVGRVFADLGEYKRLAPPVAYADILPFTQIDRNTSRPVTYKEPAIELSVSDESHAKREKYSEIKDDYAKNLDDLVEKKGEESLLALIYVDGNGMGQRVKEATGGCKLVPNGCDFEAGVNKMRKFSREINTAFVDKPLKAIEDSLGKLEEKDTLAMRRIIGGGDEITIVCNARNALKVADIYFETLKKYNTENAQNFSSCMGIAVFHAHAPFADIYEIAEQCCESGKNKIKEIQKEKQDEIDKLGKCIEEGDTDDSHKEVLDKLQEEIKEASNHSFIDAYFCRSAITGEMKDLREKQEGKTRSKMPYRIDGDFERLKELGSALNKIKRTNVKALRDAAFISKADFELELMRVKSNTEKEISFDVKDMAVFCDAAAFFDLNWFPSDGIEERSENNAKNKNNVKI